MDDAIAAIVGQWFHKAESDLLNIRNNLSSEHIPTDTVCFHAQQAVEKFLKAVMVAHGQSIYKTHDLVRLLTDVVKIIPELADYEEQFEELSEYGVAVRYPDDYYEPSVEEAKKAYALALEVEELVKRFIMP